MKCNIIFNKDVYDRIKHLTWKEYQNVCRLGRMGYSLEEALKLKNIDPEILLKLSPFLLKEYYKNSI